MAERYLVVLPPAPPRYEVRDQNAFRSQVERALNESASYLVTPHAATHESGGVDEIEITSLSGDAAASRQFLTSLSGTITWGPLQDSDVSAINHHALAGLSDDDHTQYHTDARALTWLGTRSTSDLSEGTNLYFTDERVDDRVSLLIQDVAGKLTWTYNDVAGTLTPTITYDSQYFSGTNWTDLTDGGDTTLHGHAWAQVSGTPTTLAGYGITDAAPLSHTHGKADLPTAVAYEDEANVFTQAQTIALGLPYLTLKDTDNLLSDLAYRSYVQGLDSADSSAWYVGVGGGTKHVDLYAGAGYETRVYSNGAVVLTLSGSSTLATFAGAVVLGTDPGGGHHLRAAGNALFQGTTGFDAVGEKGIVYLGDSNNGIGAENGTGLVLGVYKASGGGRLGAHTLDALILENVTGKATFAGSVVVGGNITMTPSTSYIQMDTADGSDTKNLRLAGGGDAGVGRGAYIELYGNDHASYPGELWLVAGSNGDVHIWSGVDALVLATTTGDATFAGGVGVGAASISQAGLITIDLSAGTGSSGRDFMKVTIDSTEPYATMVLAREGASNAGFRFWQDGVGKLFVVDPGGSVEFKNYTFPAADGSSGQALTTNGSGTLAWTNVASTGSLTFNTQRLENTVLNDYTMIAGGTTAGGLGSNIVLTGPSGSPASTLQFRSATTELARLTSGGHLLIGTTTDSGALSVNGKIYCSGDFEHDGSQLGFFGGGPTTKPTVSGSRSSGAALSSLLTALVTLGLITNSTTA